MMSTVARERTDRERRLDRALDGIQHLVVGRLRARGASQEEASDAFQSMCEGMLAKWPEHEERVLNWDSNRGWFVKAAFRTWLMQLRSERRRRQREERYHAMLTLDTDEPEQLTLLDLPAAKRLTALQRDYLALLAAGEMSLEDIATTHGKTVRSVYGVVSRARQTLRSGLKK